jgi:hypothetical protein
MNVLALLATVAIAKLAIPMVEMMLQYIPKKFGVSLAWVSSRILHPEVNIDVLINTQASRILSIQAVESMILLLAVLPIVKEVAQIKYRVTSTKVDLSLAQFGFMMMSVGCLVMASAQKLAIFILGTKMPFYT